MRSRPIHQLLHLRRTPIRPLLLARPVLPLPTSTSHHHLIHTSSPFLNAEQSSSSSSNTKSQSQSSSNSGPSNLPPQSPFKVFVQTLKEELQKNQDFQRDVQKLQGDVDKFADSEAMRKAKEAYERTRIIASIKENPRLRAAAEEMRKQGIALSTGVNEALKSFEQSQLYQRLSATTSALSSAAATATAPVRNTAAYKALSEGVVEALDESLRYGGYEDKEVRRRRREERKRKAGLVEGGKGRKRVEVNPNAGEALVLSDKQESDPSSAWHSRITQSDTYQNLRESYYESENPVVSSLRSVTTTIGGWFEENETARVIRMIRRLDPDFQMEAFQRELREFIVPEVVDAYLSADREALQLWCGEATYNMLWATMKQYIAQGLYSDSRVLDIRHVEISQGKITENDLPVFLITFASQEILLFRHKKTGDVAVGTPDGVEQVRYAMVLTLEEGMLDCEETGGWKVLEMARRGTKGGL